MKLFIKYYLFVFLIVFIVIIFRAWFNAGLISSGDFLYYSPVMMKEAELSQYAWGWHIVFDGFSRFISPYSWIFPFIYFPQVLFGQFLKLDWSVIERVMYLYPLLILMIISPMILVRYLFKREKFFVLSIIIYSFNTYFLEVISGGEIFVALAQSLIPIIFILFIKIRDFKGTQKYFYSALTGIVLAIQIMLDPRFTYVAMMIVGLYYLWFAVLKLIHNPLALKALPNSILTEERTKHLNPIIYNSFFIFVIPGLIAICLHAFWIIPSVLYGKSPVGVLGSAYSSVGAVQYLSFAKFENTISLLHPNWPENIFGFTHFMRPEFLVFPIIAFSSLLFISSRKVLREKEKNLILFFALLGLIGGFLAKGANEPFGNVYLWMFIHVPGFIMFRDPAKWYPLVELSYAVLIPYTLWNLGAKLMEKNFGVISKYANIIILPIFLLFWCFTIRQALFGEIGGSLKATSVPEEYVKLEKLLKSDTSFSRVLWIPSMQRFGYYSKNHPAISAKVLYTINDPYSLVKIINSQQSMLQDLSIKYIIVPSDPQKEIFITNRKYDEKLYEKTIDDIGRITWLKRVNGFKNIAIFELPYSKDHIWSSNPGLIASYIYSNPTKYTVNLHNTSKGDVIFLSEGYDSHWIAEGPKSSVKSVNYSYAINQFVLQENGNYTITLYYAPQKWVDTGVWISLITISIVAFIILLFVWFATKEIYKWRYDKI